MPFDEYLALELASNKDEVEYLLRAYGCGYREDVGELLWLLDIDHFLPHIGQLAQWLYALALFSTQEIFL